MVGCITSSHHLIPRNRHAIDLELSKPSAHSSRHLLRITRILSLHRNQTASPPIYVYLSSGKETGQGYLQMGIKLAPL
jgi:hypothetical protein